MGATVGAVAGSILATIGSRATWFVVSEGSASISIPNEGTFRFPARAVHLSGGDLSGGVMGIALLVLVGSLLSLLAGPRLRTACVAAVVVGSAALLWLSIGVERSDAIQAARGTNDISAARPEVSQKTGRAITIAGAALAGLGGIVALPSAASVGRFRMPESGPEERSGP